VRARALIRALLWPLVVAGAVACGVFPIPARSTIPEAMLNIAGQLHCDAPPQASGGEIGQLPPSGGTDTASPYPWLETLAVIDLPLSGYDEVPKLPWEDGKAGFVRFEYRAAGVVKAVIVMAGHSVNGGLGHWDVVGFRACPGDEFDPRHGRTTDHAIWVDQDGHPAHLTSSVGPGHCGWESTLWLTLDRRLYIRDPAGVLSEYTIAPFVPDAEPPKALLDTGIRSGERILLTGKDTRFVWVKTSKGLERWSGVRQEPGCM
jgi:hypothetical protein